MNRSVAACLAALFSGYASGFGALPFSLSDSDPESPEFRSRYMGIYGINAAIEPRLAEEDRPLYDQVLPRLQSHPDEAIRMIEESLAPESNAAFHFLLGSLYYAEDRLKDAKTQLEISVDKHPSFRRAHRVLALIHARNDDVSAAVKSLQTVIALGGGDGQSYGMLGYAYLRQEKYRSALVSYSNARVFAPDSFDNKRGEAQCLLQTNQHEQAIALYDELIGDRPDEAEFWLLQANALLALDRRHRAAANLEIARSLGGVAFDALALLASIYMEDGAIELGAEVAIEAMPFAKEKDFSTALRLLDYLVDREFMKAADGLAEACERWIGSRLESDSAHRFASACALIDFGLGRESSGIERLLTLLENDPLNGRGLLMLGRRYVEMGELEEAQYYLERAISVESAKGKAFVALGQLSVERREFSEAAEFLRKAQAVDFDANVQRYLEQVEAAISNVR